MVCEFLLLYSTLYMLFCSMKSCCCPGRDDDPGAPGRVFLSPVVAYGSLGEKTRGQCGDECCICMEPYEPFTAVNVLPCNHFLCHLCFQQWFALNDLKDTPLRCPLCNQVFVGDDEEEKTERIRMGTRTILPFHTFSSSSSSLY